MQIKILIFFALLLSCCKSNNANTSGHNDVKTDTLPTIRLLWLSEVLNGNKIHREKGFDIDVTYYYQGQMFVSSIKNDEGKISISLTAPQFSYLSSSHPSSFIRYHSDANKPYAQVVQQNNTSFIFKKNNSNLTIFSFTHCDSSYGIKPFQYTVHFEERNEIGSHLICIQGKEKNNELLPEFFDSSIHPILEMLLMDSISSPNVNYLFDWNDNKTKLQTTTISFDEYQQQSKWDNYLYVSTHNLGQQEKEIIREMRKMLNNHFD